MASATPPAAASKAEPKAVEGSPAPPSAEPEPAQTELKADATASSKATAAANTPAGSLTPLTDAQRALLAAGDDEDLPKRNLSFIKSNEIRHDVWFPYIEGLGGAYMGLAADTNYTLIGVARSEVVFLIDRDPQIANLHRIYGILIAASPDPETLHQRFAPENRDATLELIDAATVFLRAEHRRRIERVYRATRETLWRYLRPLKNRQRQGCPSSWMSNTDIYDHVRMLYQQGRVRILVGDIRGHTSIPTIITALEALDIPLRVLYLSNAEQYFTYNKDFRANLGALPTASGGVLLRTIYEDTWVHADNYWHYQVHDIEDFQRRLEHAFLTRTFMWRDAEREGVLQRHTESRGLSRLAVPAPGSGDEPGTSAACGQQASAAGPKSLADDARG